VATLGTKWPNEAQWRACPVKGALTSVFTVKCVLSSSVCSRHRGGETLHYISHPFMRADYVCIHCQYRGCHAIVFGWQYTMRPWVAAPNEAWVTVKCVHCQVCSQVLCAVNAGAAKRSAPIGQCQCHGLDAGATKGTDAVAAKGFALWDPLPNAKAGSEPVTCFSEIVASCFPGAFPGVCACACAQSRVRAYAILWKNACV